LELLADFNYGTLKYIT